MKVFEAFDVGGHALRVCRRKVGSTYAYFLEIEDGNGGADVGMLSGPEALALGRALVLHCNDDAPAVGGGL